MKFSFLGYCVKKIMELDLDIKDISILRYFDDFRESGKMNYEVIEGVKYYWISYKNIEEELPFLGLGKRSIMVRMLKLRDLGILSHYTKKEGGTFSYYAPGEKYPELIYDNSAEEVHEYKDRSYCKLNGKSEKTSISNNKNSKCNSCKNSKCDSCNYDDKNNNSLNNIDINNSNMDKTNMNNTDINNSDGQADNSYKTNGFNKDSNDYLDRQSSFNYEHHNNSQYCDNKDINYSENVEIYDSNINDFNNFTEENDNFIDEATMNFIKNSNHKSNINSDKVNIDTINNDVFNKNSTSNKAMTFNEEPVFNNEQGNHNYAPLEYKNHKNEDPLYLNKDTGYAEKCPTKINLLNNSSTRLNNLYNNIKNKINSIISYLNLQAGVMYKGSNSRTVNLVKARLKEGFTVEDFKTVIDKKVKAWKGTLFEQYLTPFTLFGEKFEIYLNQNITYDAAINSNKQFGNSNNSYRNTNTKNLRFHNFKGRDYDYADLEKKLLGWE